MNCEQVGMRIDDLVDGEMPPEALAGLRAHLVHCPGCDRAVRAALDLRARLAALPERVTPQRDLWPAIAAKIATRNGVARPRRAPYFAVAASAAAIAVAALVAVQVDAPTAIGPASVVVSVDPGLRLAAQTMLDSADGGAGNLSPEAVAVVRENLALIDQALREIAVALELDPDNPQLQRQLLQTYRGHAELLEYLGRVSAQPTPRTDL